MNSFVFVADMFLEDFNVFGVLCRIFKVWGKPELQKLFQKMQKRMDGLET